MSVLRRSMRRGWSIANSQVERKVLRLTCGRYSDGGPSEAGCGDFERARSCGDHGGRSDCGIHDPWSGSLVCIPARLVLTQLLVLSLHLPPRDIPSSSLCQLSVPPLSSYTAQWPTHLNLVV